MVFFGGIMMVLFWGTIIGLIVWGVRTAAGQGQRQEDAGVRPTSTRATDIAKERYARGEIGGEEFDRIINTLERHPPPTKVSV
jgi:putative membrane protein